MDTARKRRGLSAAEVEASRREHGSNSLEGGKRDGFLRQYLRSFNDPIIRILLVTLAVNAALLFRSGNVVETLGIAGAVLISTLVSTVSEYGSERAFERMRAEQANVVCRVRRGGLATVPAEELVVGDVVQLSAGDAVPADGVLLSGKLSIDQSPLNGESKEAVKLPDGGGEGGLYDRSRVFRGSLVTSGEGVFLVEAVGGATFYGMAAGQLAGESSESPLKARLAGLARTLSRIGYAAAVLVAAADLCNLLIGNSPLTLQTLAADLLHALTLGLTVVVVAVPEGLPMMITVVLSSNMLKMQRDRVMVRKLVGIETAGSLNILFTDKTGTLTRGDMSVTGLFVPRPDGGKWCRDIAGLKDPELRGLFLASLALNSQAEESEGRVTGGNATDRALFRAALGHSLPRYAKESQIPFDSSRRYSAAALSGKNGRFAAVKGAPELLLPLCTEYFAEGGTEKKLTPEVRRAVSAALTGTSGRLLALAVSRETAFVKAGGSSPLPGGMSLLGLVSIRDEPRPEAAGAVEALRHAGIQLVMLTGDAPSTAEEVARECGLTDGCTKGEVICASELSALDDAALRRRLPMLRVVARAAPTDKSRLIRAAQTSGLVTGMTGDGVNDAPALRSADVGFAMGSGSEVAKEAGDIVITDNNIASIVRAVHYGRTIFKSIRKFIVFQLTMNLCAVGISVIGPFVGVDTPVTVIQMLWVNLIMDTLAGLAFAGEPPLPEYLREPPKLRGEPVLTREMTAQILFAGAFSLALSLIYLKTPLFACCLRPDDGVFMTGFFALFIFTGVFCGVGARTSRLNLFAGLRRNPAFVLIMLAVCAVQLALVYLGGPLFRCVPLEPRELALVVCAAASVIPAEFARKALRRLRGKRSETTVKQ